MSKSLKQTIGGRAPGRPSRENSLTDACKSKKKKKARDQVITDLSTLALGDAYKKKKKKKDW